MRFALLTFIAWCAWVLVTAWLIDGYTGGSALGIALFCVDLVSAFVAAAFVLARSAE